VLTVTTAMRFLTISVTVRTMVPQAVAMPIGIARAMPIASNPVFVCAVETAWYQIANQVMRRQPTATAYASSNRHDGISNGSA